MAQASLANCWRDRWGGRMLTQLPHASNGHERAARLSTRLQLGARLMLRAAQHAGVAPRQLSFSTPSSSDWHGAPRIDLAIEHSASYWSWSRSYAWHNAPAASNPVPSSDDRNLTNFLCNQDTWRGRLFARRDIRGALSKYHSGQSYFLHSSMRLRK